MAAPMRTRESQLDADAPKQAAVCTVQMANVQCVVRDVQGAMCYVQCTTCNVQCVVHKVRGACSQTLRTLALPRAALPLFYITAKSAAGMLKAKTLR